MERESKETNDDDSNFLGSVSCQEESYDWYIIHGATMEESHHWFYLHNYQVIQKIARTKRNMKK